MNIMVKYGFDPHFFDYLTQIIAVNKFFHEKTGLHLDSEERHLVVSGGIWPLALVETAGQKRKQAKW